MPDHCHDAHFAHLCRKNLGVAGHDGKLQNFYGKTVDIELGSSGLAADLATADYLLGDRLSPETRHLIEENLERRRTPVFTNAASISRPLRSWNGHAISRIFCGRSCERRPC